MKRLDSNTRKNPKRMKKIERAFTKFRSKLFIQMHPSGEMTYELGREGLNYLRDLINQEDAP